MVVKGPHRLGEIVTGDVCCFGATAAPDAGQKGLADDELAVMSLCVVELPGLAQGELAAVEGLHLSPPSELGGQMQQGEEQVYGHDKAYQVDQRPGGHAAGFAGLKARRVRRKRRDQVGDVEFGVRSAGECDKGSGDGHHAGDVGDGVVALQLFALGKDRAGIIPLVLIGAGAGAADGVEDLLLVHQAGHDSEELGILFADALGGVQSGNGNGSGVHLNDLGGLRGAVDRVACPHQHHRRADVGTGGHHLGPGGPVVRAVLKGRAFGVVHGDVAQAVGLGVVGVAVAGGRQSQHIVPGHSGQDHKPSVGVGGSAGGQGDDALGGVGYGRVVVEDPGGGAAAVESAAQELAHLAGAVAHAVDHALIGVGADHGEDGQVVNSAGGYRQAGFVFLRVADPGVGVQGAEHGSVVHMVAVDHVVAVGHAAGVAGGQVDRAGDACPAVDVVARVVEVVLALHQGVIDGGVVEGEPAAVILVDDGQGRTAGEGSEAVFHHDFGAVLGELPGVAGVGVGIEVVVENEAGVEDQRGGQQSGHQREDRVSGAGHAAEHAVHVFFGRGFGRFRVVEIIHRGRSPPFLVLSDPILAGEGSYK